MNFTRQMETATALVIFILVGLATGLGLLVYSLARLWGWL